MFTIQSPESTAVLSFAGGADGGQSLFAGECFRGRAFCEDVWETGQTLGHTTQNLHPALQVGSRVHLVNQPSQSVIVFP